MFCSFLEVVRYSVIYTVKYVKVLYNTSVPPRNLICSSQTEKSVSEHYNWRAMSKELDRRTIHLTN